jgi:NAD(P)H-hydrate epimerase
MRRLSRAEVRDVDRRAIEEFGMTGLVLMENAGRGCADVLCELGCQGLVSIVCGKGNNAGDGFVIARHLDLRGMEVRVILVTSPDELRGDAAVNYAIVQRSGVAIVDLSGSFTGNRLDEQLAGSEWVIDALLGTGAAGSPRPPLDEAIRAINRAKAKRLAVDLPSGLDCDSGQPGSPTVIADHTCTFVAEKIGFAAPEGDGCLGEVHVVDIGVPRRLIESI